MELVLLIHTCKEAVPDLQNRKERRLAQKKKSAPKKPAAKPRKKKSTTKKAARSTTEASFSPLALARKKMADRQEMSRSFQSVLFFTLGILFILIAFIHGGAGWFALHQFVRGIFGCSILTVPLVFFYMAYQIEKSEESRSFSSCFLWSACINLLISSTVQILFVGEVGKGSFFRSISYLYRQGIRDTFRSGGVSSVLLSYPLIRIFEKTGARILILLLLFVVIMGTLHWSLRELIAYLKLPFQKVRDWLQEERDARQDLEEEEQDDFQIDIPLPGEEAPPRKASASESKRKATATNSFFDDATAPLESVSAPEPHLDELIQNATAHPAPEPTPQPPQATEKVEPIPPVTPQKEPTAPEPAAPARQVVPYVIPSIEFLKAGVSKAATPETKKELRENSDTLLATLESFGVKVRIVGIHRGPAVTQYEVQPAAGVKVSKITGLADDIALALAAEGVRIEAPIPGRAAVGIEVPNSNRDTVSLREILESDLFRNSKSKLAFAVGKDIAGNAIVGDVAKMPHMIIAGATGSGKSVCTNSIILSILVHATPDEVKLILIDPKIVEFRIYEGIPHLLIPVVTDPKKAAGALNWAVQEMLRRYQQFAAQNVRDIYDYNSKAAQPDSELEKMPQIVIAIDELADLMMAASKEVEDAICRLAQMARAAGMHLIIATQRPTTDIITGLIKANIPSRIALSVMSQIDSRTILDMGGAEKLLGHGDMLYFPNGMPKPIRVQGCFTSTKEIEAVVEFVKSQAQTEYSHEIMEEVEQNIPVTKGEKSGSDAAPEPGSDADLIEQAIEVVVLAGQASTSSLQRRLKLGYARAARIMDELEQMGVIGPSEGAKPRQVLMSRAQLEERKVRNLS